MPGKPGANFAARCGELTKEMEKVYDSLKGKTKIVLGKDSFDLK